jgi:hypothetical protein
MTIDTENILDHKQKITQKSSYHYGKVSKNKGFLGI